MNRTISKATGALLAAVVCLAACDGQLGPGGSGGSQGGGAGGGHVVGDGSGGGSSAGGGSALGAGGGDGGGTASSTGGGTTGPVAFTAGFSSCQPLTLEPAVSVSGYVSDRFNWSDGACQPRSAALVRNDGADPGGSHGGFLRELKWRSGTTDVVARGTGVNGWNGWGYVVNHYADTSADSDTQTGTHRTVFAGAHHAIHEFKLRQSPGGPVDVTIQYFFATGRSNPVYFISYDATPAGADVVSADSRAPYGDIAFEGQSGAIGGLEWGDKYRFITTGSGPLSINSAWDYTQANVVPFVRVWSQATDAEAGLVQTETWDAHLAGGDYGAGTLASQCWGKTSATKGAGCSSAGWTMPTDWLWPFQLNQYELPWTSDSHRIAWGLSFGALGQRTCNSFGRTTSGYPTLAYSVFMVIGQKSAQVTRAQVTELERSAAAQVVGGTWEPAFAVWRVPGATVTLDPKGGALTAPVFRFTGFSATSVSRVTLDGQATTHYFASVDTATQTLWLTLAGTVTGPVTLHVE